MEAPPPWSCWPMREVSATEGREVYRAPPLSWLKSSRQRASHIGLARRVGDLRLRGAGRRVAILYAGFPRRTEAAGFGPRARQRWRGPDPAGSGRSPAGPRPGRPVPEQGVEVAGRAALRRAEWLTAIQARSRATNPPSHHPRTRAGWCTLSAPAHPHPPALPRPRARADNEHQPALVRG